MRVAWQDFLEDIHREKVSYARTGVTPGGSKPNSRPASRQGSKPPSRHGSTLSLDSTDETPSRIPQRRQPSASSTPIGQQGTVPRPSRLSVTPITSKTNGAATITRTTASGSASPAPTSHNNGGMSRSSSIPILTGFGFRYSRLSRIPIRQASSDKSFPSPSSNSSSTTNSIHLSSLG